jgi:hypothetical protein
MPCSSYPRRALAAYRQRWTIQSIFANLKIKGFALEATHLTDPNKLCTLLALLAFDVALTVKNWCRDGASVSHSRQKTCRRAWSPFALGLDTFRKIVVASF